MNKRIKKYINYFQKDIWTSPTKDCSKIQSFWIKQLKIIILALWKFNQKNLRLQASAMTYYAVLSFVPGLTLIYGLMKGFGLEDTLQQELNKRLSAHQELIGTIFDLSRNYIDNIQGGIFAAVGLVILLWTVLRVLITIEDSFNNIWGVKEGKPILRKLSDYLAIFFVCPLLFVLSGSLTVIVSTQALDPVWVKELGPLLPMINVILFFLPFIVIWMTFAFLYILIPNTQVHVVSGLWGGLVAGTLYQCVQWGYVIFQVWISRSNAMYGSLAAFPLFLVWLQLSWMIILFGAEVSFAKQNLRTYESEPDKIEVSFSFKKLAAVLIAHLCVKRFEAGEKPLSLQDMAEFLRIPSRLAQEVAFDLVNGGILSKIAIDGHKDFSYQPARTINMISIQCVMDAMEHVGEEGIALRDSNEVIKIKSHVEELTAKIRKSPENILLKDI